MTRIAIVGGGIAGLGCAYTLEQAQQALSQQERLEITLFEAAPVLGGHANTVELSVDDQSFPVDTGFLVFNRSTYPELTRLFATLEVPLAPSEMSFSVRIDRPQIEWCGNDLRSVFAQRRNALRPAFVKMLFDIRRFNAHAQKLLKSADKAWQDESLGTHMETHRYGEAFWQWYFLPMISAIWSCPIAVTRRFRMGPLLKFCQQHGLLQQNDRPQWLTVAGGSRIYVDRIAARLTSAKQRVLTNEAVRGVRRTPDGIMVTTAKRLERFDHVVFASHTDQTLAMLEDPLNNELQVLQNIQYRNNTVVLHTDASVLPRSPVAWAAWNYQRATTNAEAGSGAVHYLINKLQPLPVQRPIIVSLNPLAPPASDHTAAVFEYSHPVFDRDAITAQGQLPALQGRNNTWFCGAWTGNGFHEDGLTSGIRVARQMFAQILHLLHPNISYKVDKPDSSIDQNLAPIEPSLSSSGGASAASS